MNSLMLLLTKLYHTNIIFQIPPNPTEHSLITLIVSEKTAHIKSLVDKQKTSTKKKKKNSSINGRLNKFNNHYDNKNINNTSNSSRTFVNNCQINRSHNSFSDYHVQNHRHNTSYTNNQRIQQGLPNNSINPLISSHNGFDRSNSNQNMSSGYVTLELRLYIERYIFGQHQKVTFHINYLITIFFSWYLFGMIWFDVCVSLYLVLIFLCIKRKYNFF